MALQGEPYFQDNGGNSSSPVACLPVSCPVGYFGDNIVAGFLFLCPHACFSVICIQHARCKSGAHVIWWWVQGAPAMPGMMERPFQLSLHPTTHYTIRAAAPLWRALPIHTVTALSQYARVTPATKVPFFPRPGLRSIRVDVRLFLVRIPRPLERTSRQVASPFGLARQFSLSCLDASHIMFVGRMCV